MFAELAASQGPRCLLHGDLHQTNILWDEQRGWLAIDPKGVIGEPAYEFGAALRNPDVGLADRRIHIIAERTGLDRERVAGWAYAQAVLSAGLVH
jgi:streptomycin 6-kinase